MSDEAAREIARMVLTVFHYDWPSENELTNWIDKIIVAHAPCTCPNPDGSYPHEPTNQDCLRFRP